MTSLLPNSRRPDLTVNISGRIDITSHIARALLLQPGDVIDVCCNEREFYLYVRYDAANVVGRHEGRCYPTSRHGRGGSYRTWSVRLAKALRTACGAADHMLRLPCGEAQIINGKVHIPIITRHPL